MSPTAELGSESPLTAATADQPAARLELAAAVAAPSHAYLLAGPDGSGKRTAARALAAELLAAGAADAAASRRRALAVPSPHPDLVWLAPVGAQHLVDEVRERVIGAVAYRPFEGERRVFVIEAADALAEESQNALLKTLEEPPPFAHLILISAEPESLLETVRSRCRTVRFDRLGPEAIASRLAADVQEPERSAVARLADGNLVRARFLCSAEGRELREVVEAIASAVRRGELAERPWIRLIEAAEAAGEREGAREIEAAAAAEADEAEQGGPAARRRRRDAEERAKRGSRRARTEVLDLGLALLAGWVRDLAAVGEGAPELALNADRGETLATQAGELDPRRARRAGELVMETRRRLEVNVSEELALEALVFRLEYLLAR